jgi:ribosomal protein S18 acetylase RimI-like enzyme
MKTLSIDIRKAEASDAEDIASIHHAAWQGAYSGIIPHRALNAMLARRGASWWAIGRNRSRDLKQEGEIYELYVRPEYQGIGLGTRLFGAARDRLAAHGLKGMVVWALEDNSNAVAFYEGAGGRDIAEGVEIFDQKALKKIAFVWQ